MIYVIYHIPGIKIGCTSDLARRMFQQGFTEWEILEEHTDIYVASNREIELQKEYGLPVDTIPYWQSILNRPKWINLPGREASKKGGTTTKLSGKLYEAHLKGQIARSKKVTCPHCNKIGAKFNMTRYHFDNCKLA